MLGSPSSNVPEKKSFDSFSGNCYKCALKVTREDDEYGPVDEGVLSGWR